MRAPRKQLAGNHAGIALERPLRAATMAGTHQHASLSICPSHSQTTTADSRVSSDKSPDCPGATGCWIPNLLINPRWFGDCICRSNCPCNQSCSLDQVMTNGPGSVKRSIDSTFA